MDKHPNFDKSNPFTVPDGYFEDFAAKMALMTQPSLPSLAWYRKSKSWIAIAAASIGVVIGIRVMIPNDKPLQIANQQQTVEESYILSQMDESNLVDYLCSMDESTKTEK
jgi:hypothetical protein